MKLKNNNLLAVIGATATGKTSLAVSLAKELNGEILSADSRQVYRGLDIGSGKDLHEYGEVPYHLIDIIDPTEEYNLFNFQQDFYAAFDDVQARGKTAILCGGSFLYIDAVLSGYNMSEAAVDQQLRKQWQQLTTEALRKALLDANPQLHNTTDLVDRERIMRALEISASADKLDKLDDPMPEIHPIIFTLDWPREIRTERIRQRLKERLIEGMIEEVETLHTAGVSWEKLHYFGLEYRFIAQYLQGQLNRNDMQQKLASAIVKFAKRQDTWLRKLQRKGHTIHALDTEQDLLNQAFNIIATEER